MIRVLLRNFFIVKICNFIAMGFYFGFQIIFIIDRLNIKFFFYISADFRDDTHMTAMKIVQFSRPSTPLVHLHPKFFHPLDLQSPILNETPPLQMINNQLQKNIIQGWLLYVTNSFLQFGFRIQYQRINLAWLSFDFFSFTCSLTIWLYTLVCAVEQKILQNIFHLWLFSFLVLILQSACFICATWKHKQTIERQQHRACEWNQNKSKTESGHIQIGHAFYCSI